MENNKIIRVSDVVFNFEFVFDELIKFIHVDIYQKLRCEITKRKTLIHLTPFPPSLVSLPTELGQAGRGVARRDGVRSVRMKTSNDFIEKPLGISVQMFHYDIS